MKNLLVCLFFLFTALSKTNGQATVVIDPANIVQGAKTTAEVLNVTSAINNLKQLQENIEDVKESVDWITTTTSIIRLVATLENTTCMLEDLNINLSIAADLGETTTCIDDLKYNLSTNKLLLAIDQINSALTSGVKMTRAERWEIVTIALDNFTKSQLNFSALNEKLKKKNYQLQYQNALNEKEDDAAEDFVDEMVNYYQ